MIDQAKLQDLFDRVRGMDPSEPDLILHGPGVCEVDWGTTRWLGDTMPSAGACADTVEGAP